MATNEKKMTKVSAFTIALELVENSAHPDKVAVAEKIAKEIENLSKKSSGNGKPTAKQTANMALGEKVIAFLREHPTERFTVTELLKQVPDLPADMTNQRLTALFRIPDVYAHSDRFMEKGRAYYQYAEPAISDED